MNLLTKIIGITAIALSVSTACASPKHLITHNHTGVESNAFIIRDNTTIPSVHPTHPKSHGRVPWHEVHIACGKSHGKCSALIKMETNSSHPVTIGTASIDLQSGHITFAYIDEQRCPYRFWINGLGETTITDAPPPTRTN